MASETLEHLLALGGLNKTLIDGLKAVVYYLDRADQISEEQRKSMIVSLNGLIAHSGAVYSATPTRH